MEQTTTAPVQKTGENSSAKENPAAKENPEIKDKAAEAKDIQISGLLMLNESLRIENSSQNLELQALRKEVGLLKNSQRKLNKKFLKLLKISGFSGDNLTVLDEEAAIQAENAINSSKTSERSLFSDYSTLIPEPQHDFPEPTHASLDPLRDSLHPLDDTLQPSHDSLHPSHDSLHPSNASLHPLNDSPEPLHAFLQPSHNIPHPLDDSLEPLDASPEPKYNAPKPVSSFPEPRNQSTMLRQDSGSPGRELPFDPETVYQAVMIKDPLHANCIVNGKIKNKYYRSEKRVAAFIFKALENAYCPEGFNKQRSKQITLNLILAVRKERFSHKHTIESQICITNLLVYLYLNPGQATTFHNFRSAFNYKKSHSNKILSILKEKQWVEKHKVSHASWYKLSETGKQFVEGVLASIAE